MKKIRVVELFAGVGGFRIGLEGYNGKSCSSNYSKRYKSPYEVVWSNQWEPSTKSQHANLVYQNRWPKANHSGEDIEKVIENDFKSIPDHDLLVGGFPCQDYSVATTLKNSKGLIGKKGVLWWSIYSILKKKKSKIPKYLFLENVDRLLVSPANQRGRDFAVILSCLDELGYAVEWRIINAAEYGMPQRRRRVYIVAIHKSTELYKKISKETIEDLILTTGVLAKAFPVNKINNIRTEGEINDDKEKITIEFNKGKKNSPFQNSGFMIQGKFISYKTSPKYLGNYTVLNDIVNPIENIDKTFFIQKNEKLTNPIEKTQIDGSVYIIKTQMDKWKYLKGSKKEIKINIAQGYRYKYAEGKMVFPDSLEKSSRTIITGEGGKSPSRFKHVIKQGKVLRRLTPIELERLNMFPDNHTKLDGIQDTKRAFFMGNALVIGIVELISKTLSTEINNN
jgi:DNA (cytosine-5)-methyltransferase 1